MRIGRAPDRSNDKADRLSSEAISSINRGLAQELLDRVRFLSAVCWWLLNASSA